MQRYIFTHYDHKKKEDRLFVSNVSYIAKDDNIKNEEEEESNAEPKRIINVN